MVWFNLNQNVPELGLFVHLSDIALTSFWMKLYAGFLSSLVSMHLITLGHCVYLHGWWWLARVVLIGGGRWLLYIKQGRPHPGNTRAGWAASADPQETAQLQIQSCDCGKCCLRLPLLSGPNQNHKIGILLSLSPLSSCHPLLMMGWEGKGRRGKGCRWKCWRAFASRIDVFSMDARKVFKHHHCRHFIIIVWDLKGSQWVCLCLQQKRRQRCM